MFLSKYKTKSLVGTDKEFIPITNLKYKSTIQTIRCSIEEATKAYEVDQTKVDSLKEMREYLKQNAKKRTKNKIVLNDMIRQTEEKLNRAANIYYYGNKIKNQRTTEHRPISNIDTTTNKKSSHHKMKSNNHVVNYVQKSSRSSLSSPTTNHPADIDNNIQHSITTTTDIKRNVDEEGRREIDNNSKEKNNNMMEKKSKTKFGPGKARPLYFLNKPVPLVVRYMDATATEPRKIVKNSKEKIAKSLVERMKYEKYKRKHRVEKEMNRSRRRNYNNNRNMALRSGLLTNGRNIRKTRTDNKKKNLYHNRNAFMNPIALLSSPIISSQGRRRRRINSGRINADEYDVDEKELVDDDDELCNILAGASRTCYSPAFYRKDFELFGYEY